MQLYRLLAASSTVQADLLPGGNLDSELSYSATVRPCANWDVVADWCGSRAAAASSSRRRRLILVTHSGPHRLMSRRAWLGSAGVIAAAAAGGALVALVRPDPVSGHPPGAPDWLPAALAREEQLLDGLDAAIRADPTLRVRLAPLRADHTAHLQVLQDVSSRYGPTPAKSKSSGSSAPTSVPAPTAVLGVRRAELAASRATAAAALTAVGGNAGLLASIAACEATHVAVLT